MSLLAIAAVLFARSFDLFVYPLLLVEDGTHYFAYFFAHPEPSGIFRDYAGYLSLVPNALAWLATRVEVPAQPYLFSAFTGLVNALSLWLLSSRRFRNLVPNDAVRCLVCVMLALIPTANSRLVSVVNFAHWHLLFAVTLLAFARAPRTSWQRISELVVAGLCLCSHPMTAALLPVYAWRAWSKASTRGHYATLLAIGVGYQLLFVQHGTRAAIGFFEGLATTGQMVLLRVLEEPVIGLAARAGLANLGLQAVSYALATLLLGAFVAGTWRLRGAKRRGVVGLALTALLLCGMVAFTRTNPLGPLQQWNHRYSYVPRELCYLLLVVIALALARGLARHNRIGIVVLLALHALALNLGSQAYYYGDRTEGERVRRFCEQAARWRDGVGGDGAPEMATGMATEMSTGNALRLERGPWTIELHR